MDEIEPRVGELDQSLVESMIKQKVQGENVPGALLAPAPLVCFVIPKFSFFGRRSTTSPSSSPLGEFKRGCLLCRVILGKRRFGGQIKEGE